MMPAEGGVWESDPTQYVTGHKASTSFIQRVYNPTSTKILLIPHSRILTIYSSANLVSRFSGRVM